MLSPEQATLRTIHISHNNRQVLVRIAPGASPRHVCNTGVPTLPGDLLNDDVLCLYFGRTHQDIALALQYPAAVHVLTKRADTNEWTDEHGVLSFEEFASELAACYSFRLVCQETSE